MLKSWMMRSVQAALPCTGFSGRPPLTHHQAPPIPRSPTLLLPLSLPPLFPSIPLSFSQLCGTAVSPGRSLQRCCITQGTEAGEGHSVKVKDRERERRREREGESGSIVPCRYQLLIYKAGTPFFSFILLFLALPATPQKTERYDFIEDNKLLEEEEEKGRNGQREN